MVYFEQFLVLNELLTSKVTKVSEKIRIYIILISMQIVKNGSEHDCKYLPLVLLG